MCNRTPILVGVIVTLFVLPLVAASQVYLPRTRDGRPDLSRTCDTAAVTPCQRPQRSGDRAALTAEAREESR